MDESTDGPQVFFTRRAMALVASLALSMSTPDSRLRISESLLQGFVDGGGRIVLHDHREFTALYQVECNACNLVVELFAPKFFQLRDDGLDRQPLAVRTIRRHGVEGVAHQDDARAERNVVAPQS